MSTTLWLGSGMAGTAHGEGEPGALEANQTGWVNDNDVLPAPTGSRFVEGVWLGYSPDEAAMQQGH